MPKTAGIIVDGPVTNALRVGAACGRALILAIVNAGKLVAGKGAGEGFVDSARCCLDVSNVQQQLFFEPCLFQIAQTTVCRTV